MSPSGVVPGEGAGTSTSRSTDDGGADQGPYRFFCYLFRVVKAKGCVVILFSIGVLLVIKYAPHD